MANNKAQQLIDAIKIPSKLTDKQVMLAKSFAGRKLEDGFTVGNFCKSHGMSTATWYVYMENYDFANYLREVSDAIIPNDEKEAYAKIKKKIMQISEKDNPSIKELELFNSTFSYVIEADKRERIEALGLSDESIKAGSFKTVAERKASILSRLQGDEMK